MSTARIIRRALNQSPFFMGLSLAISIVASCAQGPRIRTQTKDPVKVPVTSPPENPSTTTTTSSQEPVLAPTTELAPPSDSAPSSDPRKPFFAVWIDAYGYDGLQALSVLQELEKQNLKPAKVVGTGYGCWVAQSWALANNGNRAEWQVFKWNDWDAVRGSLIARMTGTNKSKFVENVRNLLPVRSWEQFQLPVDCALIPKEEPIRLDTSKNLSPEEAFWDSLQLEYFGVGEENLAKSGHYSGAMGGAASEAELLNFSQELKNSPDLRFAGWLVLRTHGKLKQNPSSSKNTGEFKTILAGRTDQWPSEIQSQLGGDPKPKVYVWDLGFGAERPAEDLFKMENRRRFLLDGRKKAQAFLQGEEIKKFLAYP